MITAEQRNLRRNYIGASEISAVLGLDEYRSSHDLWLSKIDLADDFAGNSSTEKGNLFEPVTLDWAERELAAPLIRHVFVADKLGLPICANLDADCPSLNAIVEAKYCSSPKTMGWGDTWTDQVPMRTVVQVMQGMFISGRKLAYVPLISPGYQSIDLSMYVVNFDAELAEMICKAADAFWTNHVIPKIPPTDSEPHYEVLKRIKREPGVVAKVPQELVERMIVARAAASEAVKDKEAAETAVLAHMTPINADGAETENGVKLTYFETHRKGYAVKDTTYRSLKVLKGSK